MKTSACLTILAIALVLPGAAFAQWDSDGVALDTFPYYFSIAADDFDGACLAWTNLIDGVIYAQRLSGNGTKQWINPIAVGNGILPVAAPDGSGGVFIAWHDDRLEPDYCDVYVARINGITGAVVGTPGGTAICTAVDQQCSPRIVADGAGGAIIVWSDTRSLLPADGDIYGQRVDANLAVQWEPNGRGICVAPGNQVSPMPTTDGAGGAIVAWVDIRSLNGDIFVRRVTAAAETLWTTNGFPLRASANNEDFGFQPEFRTTIASDNAGGAIVVWEDYRGSSVDLYAARVSSAGARLWDENGVPVTNAVGDQRHPWIVSVDAQYGGGAIVAWYDNSNYTNYVQRLRADGSRAWPTNGIACSFSGTGGPSLSLASDGMGGANVAWGNNYVTVQRITWAGHLFYGSFGTGAGIEGGAPQLVTSANGSAIVAGAGSYLIANRVPLTFTRASSIPNPIGLRVRDNFPNPFSTFTSFELSVDTGARLIADVFDVAGRRVRDLSVNVPGASWITLTFDGRDNEGHVLPAGVYFCRFTALGESVTRRIVIVH